MTQHSVLFFYSLFPFFILKSFHICFRYWQKKLQLITFVPKPNDFFKPLYHNYGGNFKVRESKNELSSVGFVCNFQIGPAGVALEGTFSTSGPRLMGLSLDFTFKGLHDVNDSVCRGFKRLFVFRLSDMLWADICVWQPDLFHPSGKYPWCIYFRSLMCHCVRLKTACFSLDGGTKGELCGLLFLSYWCFYDYLFHQLFIFSPNINSSFCLLTARDRLILFSIKYTPSYITNLKHVHILIQVYNFLNLSDSFSWEKRTMNASTVTCFLALGVLLCLNTVSVNNTNSRPSNIITLSVLWYSVKNIVIFEFVTIAPG